jgi:Mg2+ and Co2+ transporter CorA
MNGFLPPVIFEIQANAAGAIAQFRNVNKELSIMEAQALKTGKALTGIQKAAVVGTRALKVMGIAFAAFAAYGVREVILLEKSYNRLGQAMANAGVATKANLAATSEIVDSYEKLGFGADKAADAYTVLITATQNVEQSNYLLALAADLARTKTMSLEDAARALTRAQAGNARIFTQFGITLDETLPKAKAIEKAMGQLEQRLSGQALAYTKTFAGQLAILTENLGNLAEQIGMRVLPVLNKFVSGLNNTGTWIKKNSDFVIALTLAITVALIPAVVSLTKKLILLAATILKSPIARLAIIIFGVAYAFVKAYNSMEGFRKGIASIGKFIITFGEVVYRVMTTAYNGILLLSRGGINARIALGKLLGKDEWVKDGQAALKQIDEVNAGFKQNIQDFETYRKKLDDFATKPLKLNWNFKTPQIPGFENGTVDNTTNDINEMSDALINARQRVKDFNLAMKDTAKILKDTWSGIVGKDVKAAITEGLLNPVDKLIVQAQKAVNTYQAASNKYNASLGAVTAAQQDYVDAVKSGNKELIASTESALGRAEDAASALADTMQKAMEDVAKLQEQMIEAIVDSYNQIAELEKQRTEVLENASIERKDLEKNYLKDVARLRKQYDKDVLNAQQEAAKRSAEIIKQSVDQLRGVFKTATYRSLGDIFSGLTFGGMYAKGGTTEKILAALGLQTSKARRLADDAATLAGLGFSQTFIEEVVAQGPDVGHQLAQTIIKSSPESIAQMRAYWEALQKTSSTGVDAIAKQLNSGVVLATEELTAQLAQVGLDLNKQLAEYNENLTTELTDAFDAYSEALEKINVATAKQISEIDAQIATLQARIAQLQYALAQLANLSAPGNQGVAPDLKTKVIKTKTDTEDASLDALLEMAEAATAHANAVADVLDMQNKADEIAFKAYQTKVGVTANGKQLVDVGQVAQSSLLRGLSKGAGVAGAVSGSRYAAQAANQYNITIKAQTNASSQDIASDVGWAIRTSSDVQYRVNRADAMGFE